MMILIRPTPKAENVNLTKPLKAREVLFLFICKCRDISLGFNISLYYNFR